MIQTREKTCNESSDSCEQWQLSDGKQPCSGIRKFGSTEHQETSGDKASVEESQTDDEGKERETNPEV